MLACSLQHVERSCRVDLEIIERPKRCKIMARLSRAMRDRSWVDRPDQVIDSATVAQVKFVVNKIGIATRETLLVPACIPGRSEEARAHVVVDAMNAPVAVGEIGYYFRSDQPVRTGHQEHFDHYAETLPDNLSLSCHRIIVG